MWMSVILYKVIKRNHNMAVNINFGYGFDCQTLKIGLKV